MAGVPAKVATSAAAGWGGDRAFLFERNGATPLFVWKTLWDKPSDATEFFEAYRAMNAHQGEQENLVWSSGDKAEVHWQANGRTTILKRSGDAVIIVRGAEVDSAAAVAYAER
jgi:hypothetical protein